MPDLDLGDARDYTFFAKKSLLDPEWTPFAELPDLLDGEWQFFYVVVAMPAAEDP
jgi:hypothetical protein